MSDPQRTLRETLHQLRQQLDAAENMDPTVATHVREAVGELEAALAQPDAVPGHPSLVHRLSEAAADFEQSHPTLSGTLVRLVDVLAQMGI